MTILPIASGSSGNCYLVKVNRCSILIECGIPIISISKALWGIHTMLADIDFCLVSHSHGDHCKAAKDLVRMGIPIIASTETLSALGMEKGRFAREIEPQKEISLGAADISCFRVEHDAEGTLGFIIHDPLALDRLMYVTDTPYLPVAARGITHMMIEANYDPDIIQENVKNGMNLKRAVRTARNHMSIETTLATLEKMDKSKLKEVWLLHLSKDNAGDDFKRRAQEICGCEVYVA